MWQGNSNAENHLAVICQTTKCTVMGTLQIGIFDQDVTLILFSIFLHFSRFAFSVYCLFCDENFPYVDRAHPRQCSYLCIHILQYFMHPHSTYCYVCVCELHAVWSVIRSWVTIATTATATAICRFVLCFFRHAFSFSLVLCHSFEYYICSERLYLSFTWFWPFFFRYVWVRASV